MRHSFGWAEARRAAAVLEGGEQVVVCGGGGARNRGGDQWGILRGHVWTCGVGSHAERHRLRGRSICTPRNPSAARRAGVNLAGRWSGRRGKAMARLVQDQSGRLAEGQGGWCPLPRSGSCSIPQRHRPLAMGGLPREQAAGAGPAARQRRTYWGACDLGGCTLWVCSRDPGLEHSALGSRGLPHVT